MKNIILTTVAVFSIGYLSAQSGIMGTKPLTETQDANGRPLTEVNKLIAGSPVLNENWGKGDVIFRNGSILKNVDLQFDLSTNELHFRKNNTVFAFTDSIQEFSMEYIEDDQMKNVTFRSGYPPVLKRTGAFFYQVIAGGDKVQFLKYVSKQIQESQAYAGPTTKEFKLSGTYYAYNVLTNEITAVSLNKSSIVKALPTYTGPIKKIAEERNYSLKTEAEVAALFRLLN